MNEDELLILSNALNDEFGFQLIFILLKKFGAFERGLNRNASDKEVFMTLGKREQGAWLIDNVFKANQQKYIEFLKMNEKEKKHVR